MFCALSQSAFVRHFDLCKSRIKHELYLTVDNMVDRVYDQALTDLHQFATLDQTRLMRHRVDTNSGPVSFPFSCHNQSTTFIPPNVTHLANISLTPTSSHLTHQHITTHHSQPPLTEQIPIDPLSSRQSSTSPFPPPPVSITNVQFRQMSIENEIEATATEPMSPVQSQPPLPSLSPSMVNEQSNNNLNDQEICECDECLNGIDIDQQLEDDDDDSESVQWIDDVLEDGESSRPVKEPRMDTAPPNNAQAEVTGQSPSQPTDETQPNKVHDKHIITLGLQCPELNCSEMFVPNEHYSLFNHMWHKHSIRPFQCLIKNCGQSFDYRIILRDHIKQAHHNITQWQCGKCSKYFATYRILFIHNYQQHQLGLFQCSFHPCTFTWEYRMKVANHYKQQHKPELVCTQTGCNYRTYNVTRFRAHERAHLGIKPYRCKWPNCEIASSYQHNVLGHIQTRHLASLQNANQNVAHSADPKDYLEVASELLL